MTQEVGSVKLYEVFRYEDKLWYAVNKVHSSNGQFVCITGEVYREIPKETMVEVVSTLEHNAKYFLKNHK